MTTDERIRRVFADVFEVESNAVDDDFSVETCDAWDSMQSIVLASSLEDEFEITFSEEELMHFVGFSAVRGFVESHLRRSGAA